MNDLKTLLKEYQQTATDIQLKLAQLKALAPKTKGKEHILIGKRIAQLEEMYIDVCFAMREIERSLR